MSSLIVDNGTLAMLMMSDHDSEGNASGSSSGGSRAPTGVSASGSSGAFSGEYKDSSGSGSDLSILFSGESASGNDSAVSGSGNYSGSASGDESGSTSDEPYTVSVLLQVRAEDGGLQCSDAGQYECIAGVTSPGLQAGSTISVNISVATAGKLRLAIYII